MSTTTLKPACSICHRAFARGITWSGSNFCRALFLVDYIADGNEGLSGWELSQGTGIEYQDTVRGMSKARAYRVIEARAEVKEGGGARYRYWMLPDHTEQRAEFSNIVLESDKPSTPARVK
jgi:hypothetical protein